MPSRDLGGVCTLNDPDDATPIKKMFVLKDGLLLISEKCTYRLQEANQIDSDRKNPDLPSNFQQKLFEYGTTSELLCRTLLQAEVMFRKEFQSVDIDRAMQLSFDALAKTSMPKAVPIIRGDLTATGLRQIGTMRRYFH